MKITYKLKQNIIQFFNALNKFINYKAINFLKTFIAMLKIEIKISLIIFTFSIIVLAGYITFTPKNSYAIAINNNEQEKIKYQEIIDLTNIERKKYNLNELKYNPQLKKIADIRIMDMKNMHYFAHINPDGKGLKYFIEQVDYNYSIAGENLAMNYYDDSEVVQAWMESQSHKKNILKSSYQEIGMSSGKIEIDGKEKFITVMILGVER